MVPRMSLITFADWIDRFGGLPEAGHDDSAIVLHRGITIGSTADIRHHGERRQPEKRFRRVLPERRGLHSPERRMSWERRGLDSPERRRH